MSDPTRTTASLRAALLEALTSHAELPENDMYRAFGEAVRTLRELRDDATSKPPPPKPARQVKREPGPATATSQRTLAETAPRVAPTTRESATARFHESEGQRVGAKRGDDGIWLVTVELTTQARLMSFGQQLHQAGVQLNFVRSPPLNASVDVCVLLPITDAEIWLEGRVVFVGSGGTALSLKPAQADHPQLWNRATEAFAKGLAPVRAEPRDVPQTEPPRLRAVRPGSRTARGAASRSGRPSPLSRSAKPGGSRPTQATRVPAGSRATTRSSSSIRPAQSRGSRSTASAESISRPSASPSRQSGSPSRSADAASRTTRPTSAGTPSGSAGPASRGGSATRSGRSASRPTGPSSRSPSKPPSVRSRPSRSAGVQGPSSRGARPAPGPVETPRPQPDIPVPSYARLLIALRNNGSKAGVADHFAMLGLHWSAYQAEIDEAWAREKFMVDPAHYPDTLSPEDQARRASVDAALDQAYETLRNPQSRRAYRLQIVDKMNLTSAVGLYWDKGDTALLRSDPTAARDFLLRALELDPDHKAARAKLAAAESELGLKR